MQQRQKTPTLNEAQAELNSILAKKKGNNLTYEDQKEYNFQEMTIRKYIEMIGDYRFRAAPCLFYLKDKCCKGDYCQFIHSYKCKNEFDCTFGNNCAFKHSKEEREFFETGKKPTPPKAPQPQQQEQAPQQQQQQQQQQHQQEQEQAPPQQQKAPQKQAQPRQAPQPRKQSSPSRYFKKNWADLEDSENGDGDGDDEEFIRAQVESEELAKKEEDIRRKEEEEIERARRESEEEHLRREKIRREEEESARREKVFEDAKKKYNEIFLNIFKNNYRQLSLKVHPDKNDNKIDATIEFQALNEVYSSIMTKMLKAEN
jgi:hypothetical protein